MNLFCNEHGAFILNGAIWFNNKPDATESKYDYCITSISNFNTELKNDDFTEKLTIDQIAKQKQVNAKKIKLFKYKDIFALDTVYRNPKFELTSKCMPSDFFGTWILEEITQYGDKISSKDRKRYELGDSLIISESKYSFTVFGSKTVMFRPKYKIRLLDMDENNRGTSFNAGYREDRKFLYELYVTGKYNDVFELVTKTEIVYYYNGSFYFFHRNVKENTTIQ